jgi:hypothetical protein
MGDPDALHFTIHHVVHDPVCHNVHVTLLACLPGGTGKSLMVWNSCVTGRAGISEPKNKRQTALKGRSSSAALTPALKTYVTVSIVVGKLAGKAGEVT